MSTASISTPGNSCSPPSGRSARRSSSRTTRTSLRAWACLQPALGAEQWSFRAGIGIYFDQTQMNETQFITNGPPIFTQQNINLTGRGLPEYEFGRNTLPVVTIPPDRRELHHAQRHQSVCRGDRRPQTARLHVDILGAEVVLARLAGGSSICRVRRAVGCRNATTPMPTSTPGVLYDVTPGVATRYPQLESDAVFIPVGLV